MDEWDRLEHLRRIRERKEKRQQREEDEIPVSFLASSVFIHTGCMRITNTIFPNLQAKMGINLVLYIIGIGHGMKIRKIIPAREISVLKNWLNRFSQIQTPGAAGSIYRHI